MTGEDDRKYFTNLMLRFNALGCQLPTEADIRNKHTRAAAISTAKVLLREMEQTKCEIDKLLGIEHHPLSGTRNTELKEQS